MHIQVVTFGLQGVSDEEYQAGCQEAAETFAGIPGLISKVWLRDEMRGVYGGMKVWRDRQAMEAYLKSHIWRELVTDPNIVNAHTQDFGVIEGPTRVTRGYPAVLA